MSKEKEEYRLFMKEVNRWKNARQIYWPWFTAILDIREQDCAAYTLAPYSLYFTKEQQDRIRELMESYDKCNPDAARKLDPFMEEVVKWLDENRLTRQWLAHTTGIPYLTMTYYSSYCHGRTVIPEHRENIQKVMDEYQPELHRAVRPVVEVHWDKDRNKYLAYFPELTHQLAAHGNTRSNAVRNAEKLLKARYPRDVMR